MISVPSFLDVVIFSFEVVGCAHFHDTPLLLIVLMLSFMVIVIAEGSKSAAVSGGVAPSKPLKQPSQKKDAPPIASSVVTSDKKGGDRPSDKERKKDVPPPRMQFDDKSRVEKAKRRAMVNQTEARNRVELFRHLPQYERGSQLPDLESKFFQLESMHPAIYKVSTNPQS